MIVVTQVNTKNGQKYDDDTGMYFIINLSWNASSSVLPGAATNEMLQLIQ